MLESAQLRLSSRVQVPVHICGLMGGCPQIYLFSTVVLALLGYGAKQLQPYVLGLRGVPLHKLGSHSPTKASGSTTATDSSLLRPRELRAFIFVFEACHRIVLEVPEYGNATYFFELESPMPEAGQVRKTN